MGNFRRSERYKFRLHVMFKSGDRVTPALTDDVSFHGVFIRTDEVRTANQLIKFSVVDPRTETHCDLMGIVARVVTPRLATRDRPPGVGVSLFGNDRAVEAQWIDLVRKVKEWTAAGLDKPPELEVRRTRRQRPAPTPDQLEQADLPAQAGPPAAEPAGKAGGQGAPTVRVTRTRLGMPRPPIDPRAGTSDGTVTLASKPPSPKSPSGAGAPAPRKHGSAGQPSAAAQGTAAFGHPPSTSRPPGGLPPPSTPPPSVPPPAGLVTAGAPPPRSAFEDAPPITASHMKIPPPEDTAALPPRKGPGSLPPAPSPPEPALAQRGTPPAARSEPIDAVRRAHVRRPAPAGFNVTLRPEGIAELAEFELKDISEGGTFVLTQKLIPVGSRVNVRLIHPSSEERFNIPGQVVRSIDSIEASEKGIGIRFERGAIDQATWDAFIARNAPVRKPEGLDLLPLRTAPASAPPRPAATPPPVPSGTLPPGRRDPSPVLGPGERPSLSPASAPPIVLGPGERPLPMPAADDEVEALPVEPQPHHKPK